MWQGRVMSGLYPTSAVDSSRVSPTDAAVTMRSLRRRFTAALVPPGDDDRPDDVAHRRPADGGLSAVEHAAWVGSALPQLGEALRLILISADPAVALPSLEPHPPVDGGALPAVDVVARVADAADAVAGAIENVAGDDWVRAGHGGGATITALDVVRGAVELAIHHLRAAEQTMTRVLQESR
jgi:hypothetical protein